MIVIDDNVETWQAEVWRAPSFRGLCWLASTRRPSPSGRSSQTWSGWSPSFTSRYSSGSGERERDCQTDIFVASWWPIWYEDVPPSYCHTIIQSNHCITVFIVEIVYVLVVLIVDVGKCSLLGLPLHLHIPQSLTRMMSHTSYLSFFLHGHNFWLKFSPHNSA